MSTPTPPRIVTAPEAAAVTGVTLRDVHRVIDEDILPEAFLRPDGRRSVLESGIPLISFYFHAADKLTAVERNVAIRHFSTLLICDEPKARRSDRLLKDGFLTIDFEPFMVLARRGLDRLAQARRSVVSSADILGGTPVVRGTRVPVYDVAASLAKGVSAERVAAAYPSLSAEQIDLCALYAKANPLRGRPRKADLPEGARIIRRVSRPRRGAGETAD